MQSSYEKIRWFFRKYAASVRLFLSGLLIVSVFIGILFLIILPTIEQAFMDAKREKLKEQVEMIVTQLSYLHDEELRGAMTREEAQKKAISMIRTVRYGPENKDYFWINDMEPVMVMHPYRTDLEWKNLSDFSDPHGKHLFVDFVRVVREQGAGYVNYMWQWKDDPKRIVPKISYVKEFKPWGWIVGTGLYVEDVNMAISAISHKFLLINLLDLLVITVLLIYNIIIWGKTEHEKNTYERTIDYNDLHYRRLLDGLPVWYAQIDPQGNVISANALLFQLFSCPPESDPAPYLALISLKEKTFFDLLGDLRREGVLTDMEGTFRDEWGAARWLKITARWVYGKSGKVTAYDCIFDDVTRYKRTEENLRESYDRLQEINHRKDDFLNVASHELRTPMTSVKGYISMVLDGDVGEIGPEVRKYLERVYESSNRLISLINDMLDIAKIESGNQDWEFEVADISAIVQDLHVEFLPMFQSKSQSFELYVQEEERMCLIDVGKFRQVLINLLSNAHKFTPEHGTIKMRLRTIQSGREYEIHVEDTGMGIEPQHLDRIFEKFWQIHNSLTREIKGTGLWLAIVRTIIEKFWGGVTVESTVWRGSVFVIRLPAYQGVTDPQEEGIVGA